MPHIAENKNNLNLDILEKIAETIHIKAMEYCKTKKKAFIVGISGSVSVGKTTTSKKISHIIQKYKILNKIKVISTDSFLMNLEELNKKELLDRKGFPESYNNELMIKFIKNVRDNKKQINTPVYSQKHYDILEKKFNTFTAPDILIIEGLNTLNPNKKLKDMINYKIYIDANDKLIKKWYLNRFIQAKRTKFQDPESYFHNISKMSDREAIKIGIKYWNNINLKNLEENILPNKRYADMVIQKTTNHYIKNIEIKDKLTAPD